MQTTFQTIIYLLILSVLVVSSLSLYFVLEFSKMHRRIINELREIGQSLSEINDLEEENAQSIKNLSSHIDDNFSDLMKYLDKTPSSITKPNNWDSLKECMKKPRMRSEIDV